MKNLTKLLSVFFILSSCSKPDPCGCIDHMVNSAVHGGSHETKWLKCMKDYYDEAFDFYKENDPCNCLKFQNYEAVLEAYLYDKCKNKLVYTKINEEDTKIEYDNYVGDMVFDNSKWSTKTEGDFICYLHKDPCNKRDNKITELTHMQEIMFLDWVSHGHYKHCEGSDWAKIKTKEGLIGYMRSSAFLSGENETGDSGETETMYEGMYGE